MSIATSFADKPIPERSTSVYTATLRDDLNQAVPAASLTTVTLTLYDIETDTIINSRDGQNILNANNVTISSMGKLTWAMQKADNIIVNSSLGIGCLECHKALIAYSWASGTKERKHEAVFFVENLNRVT